MKLVPDWKDAWRWWSIQIATLIAAVNLAWETLPKEALDVIPVDLRGWITLVLSVLMIGARLVQQGKPA